MPNKFVAIATDLDSTFMHHGMTISALNRQMTQSAVASGMHFVVASGRQQPAIAQVMKKVGVSGAKVCLNGAYVVSDADQVLVASTLAPDLVLALLPLAQAAGANMMCYLKRGVLRYDVTNALGWRLLFRLHDRRNHSFKTAESLAALLPQHAVYKVGFNHPDHQVLVGIEAQLKKRADIELVWASANFLEVTNAGINKLSGLQALATSWGSDVAHFVAFGDYENDLAMLQGVGLGVAMSNAIAPVQQVADTVVDNSDYQGVGRIIQQLLDTAE